MITFPITPVAESSPITVSTKIAAIALPTHHRRRLPGPMTIHASAATPSPSSKNHGSLKNSTLTGPPAAALRILSSAEVLALDVREPSLEEIFLEYYGQPAR